jgi:hypothetical protein
MAPTPTAFCFTAGRDNEGVETKAVNSLKTNGTVTVLLPIQAATLQYFK